MLLCVNKWDRFHLVTQRINTYIIIITDGIGSFDSIDNQCLTNRIKFIHRIRLDNGHQSIRSHERFIDEECASLGNAAFL